MATNDAAKTGRRTELYPAIAEMRADGYQWWEIGEHLGLSKSTVFDYFTDPGGSQVWERKHKGRCGSCSKPICNDAVICRECVKETAWNETIKLLKQFASREGHTNVPQKHSEDTKRLGIRVSIVRQQRRTGKLNAQQIAELESLPGWSWGYSRQAR